MKDDKPTPKKHSPSQIANQVQQALKRNGNRSHAAGAFVLEGDIIKPGASK